MSETLAIIELIFLLPSLILGVAINLIRHFILGQKVDETDKQYKSLHYIFSLFIWLVIGGWILYQSQFKTIYYVYACSSSGNSKCYKVAADYVPKDCEDTEWDTRGAHGGRCTDPYFEKIYFENGGYITFEYCDMENQDKWTCYAENRNDGVWNLQISEIIKVKK
jgi:hypothetical protein